MTDETATRRARPPLLAIVDYALRACLSGRRWIGILLPCGAALLLGFLAGALGDEPVRDFAEMAVLALYGLVLPVTCLVVGDAVLGAEVRSGAFAFTWLSPVPTWEIAVGRWLGGTIVAGSCLSITFAFAAVIAGAGGSAGAAAVAAAAGAAAYVAMFIAIGCVTNRAAAWSLGFVFLVERLLGTALAGIAQLSPSWESRAAFIGLSGGSSDLEREGIPQGGAAIVRLLFITAVALLLASRRLKTLKLTGSSD